MDKPLFLQDERAKSTYMVFSLRGDNPFPVVYDWRISDSHETSGIEETLNLCLRIIDSRCRRETNIREKVLDGGVHIFYRDERLGPLVMFMPKSLYKEKVKFYEETLKISSGRDTIYLAYFFPEFNPLNFERWPSE